MLDLIGYATVPEDAQVAGGLLRDSLLYLMSLPWWLPWGFALVSTLCLMWVSWPRQMNTASGESQNTVDDAISPKADTESISKAALEEAAQEVTTQKESVPSAYEHTLTYYTDIKINIDTAALIYADLGGAYYPVESGAKTLLQRCVDGKLDVWGSRIIEPPTDSDDGEHGPLIQIPSDELRDLIISKWPDEYYLHTRSFGRLYLKAVHGEGGYVKVQFSLPQITEDRCY